MKKGFIFLISILGTIGCWAQSGTDSGNDELYYFRSLLVPALIAAIGYILKTIYEALVERSKRRRIQLEEKLKNFYWPILTRLEQNTAIWKLILSKRNEINELEKRIGEYVEAHIVLKNHREIMTIIIASRYHAKFDERLSAQLHDYFRHVAIYEGIIESKENTLPGWIGAPYPSKFDEIIRVTTEELQKKLDKKGIF